jgi:D-tagatose-1,6-bisphosphate aldolase subunit GatZ/KbaZ
MDNPLINLVAAHKKGRTVGICSICSANRFVLQAAMLMSMSDRSVLLVEATSNQVNQQGGYTGMTPTQFAAYVKRIADEIEFPFERVMLGGDHLGPNPWQNERAEVAMAHARELARACVEAGFRKIHLDTSMPCADDPLDAHGALPMKLAVERAAELAKVCESSFAHLSEKTSTPIYVIGTEVPPPGGAREVIDHLAPTEVRHAEQAVEETRKAFFAAGIEAAWPRSIALVVQPGVEFGDASIFAYRRSDKTAALKKFIEVQQTLVFEAHSTDYQSQTALSELVEDHFAILKVGPWLTLALREAVFALVSMEQEWLAARKSARLSALREVLDEVMIAKPQHWQKHYHGDHDEIALARRFSYSDRLRYYWNEPRVENALSVLLNNMTENPPPMTLLSQYLPAQYWAVREGRIRYKPVDWIHHKIEEVLEIYAVATRSREHSVD